MSTLTEHARPTLIESPEWAPVSIPTCASGDESFVRAAGHAARMLPPEIHDALVDFADSPPQAGAIVLCGVPIGEPPATPDSPTATTVKDHVSEFTLLTVARRLGQPIGYEPSTAATWCRTSSPREQAPIAR